MVSSRRASAQRSAYATAPNPPRHCSEQQGDPPDHLPLFAIQPRSGHPRHPDPDEQQVLLPLAISLERRPRPVRLEDVQFDREAELRSVAVELEPMDDEVRTRLRQPRLEA